METAKNANVVVLSEHEAAMQFATRLHAPAGDVTCYANMEDLMHAQSLSSVAVLVIDTPPKGVLLAALGRMSLEYPAMQKIAVMDKPPSIQVASYLAACGVDLVWRGAGEESLDKLAAVVDRTCERAKWLVN